MSSENQAYSPEFRAEAFEHWCESQNMSETAEKMECARTTLIRIAEQDNWKDRYEKIISTFRKEQDKKILKQMTENLKFIDAIKKKTLNQILSDKGRRVSVSDFVKLCEYEDKLKMRDKGLNVDQPIFQVHLHEKILGEFEAPSE